MLLCHCACIVLYVQMVTCNDYCYKLWSVHLYVLNQCACTCIYFCVYVHSFRGGRGLRGNLRFPPPPPKNIINLPKNNLFRWSPHYQFNSESHQNLVWIPPLIEANILANHSEQLIYRVHVLYMYCWDIELKQVLTSTQLVYCVLVEVLLHTWGSTCSSRFTPIFKW